MQTVVLKIYGTKMRMRAGKESILLENLIKKAGEVPAF